MPKVSVVSSAYNHGKYIGLAIESVLRQSAADFDYTICNDASTDNTLSEINRFSDPRLRVLENKWNSGSAVASLRALEQSHGQYVTWFSADDVMEPDALEKLASALDDDPELLGVAGLGRFINEEGELTEETWSDEGVGLDRFQLLNRLFYQKNVFCCPTFTMRREAIDAVGYFPVQFKQIGDQALWTKLLFLGKVKILPDHIVRFRIRDNQANGSASTPQTLSRFDFEISEVLELFNDGIKSIDALLKIFPQAGKFEWPLLDELIPFFLAHIAMAFPHPAYELFGIRLIHRMMATERTAGMLQENCGFTYGDFFELTGNTHLFKDHELRERFASMERTVENQAQEIERANRYCRELEKINQEILSSTSWKLTAPLRHLRSRINADTR